MSTSPASVPLPPLPPTLSAGKENPETLQISENQESSKRRDVFEQCKNIVFDQLASQPETEGKHETKWILRNIHVTPKLQGSTPRCGLVCLSMAAEMAQLTKQTRLQPTALINKPRYNTTESELTALLTLAKQTSFSNQGEMFSAKNLSVLANQFYGAETKVTDCGFDNLNTITNHLYEGNPLLVPYDASPNHEPYRANGNKSHWAVITGFFSKFDDKAYDWFKLQDHCTITNLQVEENCSTIYTLDRPGTSGVQLPSHFNTLSLYFLARQPKSRHVAMWPWKILQDSNANLYEYSKEKGSTREFVFPDGGVYEGLCNKVVYLWQS